MASDDQLDQDLEEIAARTEELLSDALTPEETRALLDAFLVELDGSPERLNRELEKFAGDKQGLLKMLEEQKP